MNRTVHVVRKASMVKPMTNKDIPVVTINGHKVTLKRKPFKSPKGTTIVGKYYLGDLYEDDDTSRTNYHLGLLVSGVKIVKDKTK